MYLSTESPAHSIRAHGDWLLVGGESHKTGQADAAERFARLSAWAGERFGLEPELRWATQDQMPADGVPYVGRHDPLSPNLWVATGFKKWGLAMGSAAAELLAAQIAGREHRWAELFDPNRLRPRAGAPTFVKENANVAYHFFADRVRNHGAPRCTHLGCLLDWNDAERTWDCPCHGSRFAASGEVIEGPAVAAPEPAGPELAQESAIRRRSPAISSTTSRSPSIRASASVTWSPARSKWRSTRESPISRPVTSTRSSQRGSDGRTILRRLSSASGFRPRPDLSRYGIEPGGPRLGLAGDGIGHGLVELRAREAGEQLRQPVVPEPRRRLEQSLEDLREVLVEPVAAQPERDQRAVVRPYGAGVVADRVVGGVALGKRADAPAGEHVVAHQHVADAVRPLLGDRVRPEQVALVRGERRSGPLLGVEPDRVAAGLLEPEALELGLHRRGLGPQPLCARAVAVQLEHARHLPLGADHVALHLHERDRRHSGSPA